MFVLNILGFFCVFDKSRNLKEKKLHKSIITITIFKTHTHAEKNDRNNNKRQYQPPPLKKKEPYNTTNGGTHDSSQGIRVVNCYHKELHPRCGTDPRSSSVLCKCNLTKSYLTSVSLLKYFPISQWSFLLVLHHSHVASFLYPICL